MNRALACKPVQLSYCVEISKVWPLPKLKSQFSFVDMNEALWSPPEVGFDRIAGEIVSKYNLFKQMKLPNCVQLQPTGSG